MFALGFESTEKEIQKMLSQTNEDGSDTIELEEFLEMMARTILTRPLPLAVEHLVQSCLHSPTPAIICRLSWTIVIKYPQ